MKLNKNIAKKLISGLLVIALLVSSMSGIVLTSYAATGVSYIERAWNASSKTVSSATKIALATTVTANDSVFGEAGRITYYVVNSAVTSTRSQIEVYGEVHLILNQKFSIAGKIVVQENSTLHIYEAANAQNAALDVHYILSDGKAVAIHGGTVTTPREYGTLRRGLEIRDGNFYLYSGTVNGTIGKTSSGNAGGSILIYGGTVNAYTDDAQGLIGADSGSYESVEIYNATIKGYRTVESTAALIGGKEVGKIIIHNSNVDVDYDGYELQSGNKTHAIGGGSSNSRISEITITNSTVRAWGGARGSGIGGYVDTITLKDSNVYASAGDFSNPVGVAIGGSYCNQIIIDGGFVTTDTADDNKNWTGKGYYAKNITVKKGTVDTHEGMHINGGTLVITGGSVLGTISGATPTNNDGTTLYAREITLNGAADGTAVGAITGVPSYYKFSGIRTIGSKICVWVPAENAPSVVSVGNNQYSGAMTSGAANRTATFNKLHTCADGDNDGLCNQCEELMPPSKEGDFYLIYDLEDYQYLKKLVEGTLKSGLANRSANAKLMASIDVGATTIGTDMFPYGGVFDGNFKTLTVEREYRDRNGTDPIAPFLYVDGAAFKRLTIAGSIYVDHYNRSIKTTDIGGFVAVTKGDPVTFEQCVNKATVEANNYSGPTVNLGGFVGMNHTTLTFNNCASLGTIATSRNAGGSGFVGNSSGASAVYVNDSYIYLTMEVAGNNNYANSYFCRNENYTFLSNTYVYINMKRYNGNQGWINSQNRKNKDGDNDITNVEAAEINNGSVTYNLNKGNASGIWKQTLTGDNPDKYPVFSGANVVPNVANDAYDNHAHNPKYEPATVNVENDSVRVTCPVCAPDGVCITVSIEDGTIHAWYNRPKATITHPNLAEFYYMEGDTILKSAPTNAGNYTVNFEYGGINVSVPYSILPRDFTKASVTSNGNFIYTGEEQSASFTVKESGDVLVEGEDYTLSNHKQTNVGTYEVTITGIGNYAGTKTAKFSITKASNTWTTSPSIKGWTYGEEPNEPVYKAKLGTPTIRYQGETYGGEVYDSDKAPTQAGEYKVVFTVNGTNYANLSRTVSFTVKKATLTVTADDKAITYGDTAPDYTVRHEGFVNGEDKEVLGGELITNSEYSQYDDKGSYSIIPSGYTSGNYNITYKNGTLTVNSKPITVTIDDKSSVYGQDIVTLTAKTDGIVNDDQNVYSLSTTATKTSDVGEYTITGTTLDDNYDITFVDGKYTITKAVAAVTSAPSAKNGLVYNKTAQALLSDAGTAIGGKMQYSLNGVDYSSNIPTATNADTYTVWYKVKGDSNHNDAEAKSLNVTIDKATVDFSGVKWNYTAPFKYDGKSHGVAIDESTMPEGAYVSNYTGHSGIETGKYQAAAAILYDANYKGEATLFLEWEIANNWTPTEYTASVLNDKGWTNQNFVITAADGYLISTTNTAYGEWKDKLTYADETDNGSVTFYLKNKTDETISLAKTVNYKLDKTVAIGRVEFAKRIGWEEFVHNITFGLFYKDEVTVKVTENDNLSGVAKIEYACSDKAMTLSEVEAIADWTEYNGSFGVTVEDTKQFVYFVRITDNAGNVTYLSTDGAEYDTTAPVISGVEDGKTYYTTQKVTVIEKNVKSITLNGNPASENITLDGNKEETYTMVVTDMVGNSTTVTVTMKPISDLSVPIDTLTKDDVNSSNEDAVDGVKAAISAVDTTNATEEEKAALKEIADKAAELEKIIDDAKAEITRINEELNKHNVDSVTSDDKEDLEQLLADIEKQLESTNLTEEEISELNDDKKAVEDLLTKIKATDELIDKLTNDVDGYSDDTVKSTDKDAIEQITRDIDALLETDNLTEDEKKALEGAKEKAEGLLDIIEDAAKATETENTEKAKDVTAENVTPKDKNDLEGAKADLEKALEDHASNMTDDEKKAIEDEIKRITDALEVIGNVEAVLELIDKLPDTIKKDDEAAIKAADDALSALPDYEKSLVNEDAKKALDDAKAALAELSKPAGSSSPDTGDNSNMFLWIALLFISCGAVITLTVVDRKRRYTAKR